MRSKGDPASLYQDQKLQAIGRLTLIALILSVSLALALIFPGTTDGIVRHLPLSRNGNEYVVVVGTLATIVPICWGVAMGLIFTSPEQEVRFVRWSKRWRKAPIPFEDFEFDTADPDYRKSAWRYLIERHSR
ncbi:MULTISPECIES: hypothetical protein [unclassified Sphingomonas]|nr:MULTISPECIES: hypothetical protein [unclassified Sphingomonas]KQM61373.1 hypothetical protein ASE65_07470 [Sphingomonas sp. Leaf16]KQN12468.1 hypothetical protein ASE81_08480 [Sphingomonas sp. Leaf29]KQN18949.1 hypothetical protein ASE83_08405 [Sphingomonas sp. Leaf32]